MELALDPPGSAKVRQHHSTPCRQTCHQNILGFDVSMDYVILMEKTQGNQYLSNDDRSFDFDQLSIFRFDIGE